MAGKFAVCSSYSPFGECLGNIGNTEAPTVFAVIKEERKLLPLFLSRFAEEDWTSKGVWIWNFQRSFSSIDLNVGHRMLPHIKAGGQRGDCSAFKGDQGGDVRGNIYIDDRPVLLLTGNRSRLKTLRCTAADCFDWTEEVD